MGNHPVERPVLLELAHQGCVPAVHDLDDPTLGPIAARPPLQGGQHRISLHGLAQMLGGNEHIALQFWRPLVRDDKAVAVPVDRDPSRHQGLPGRNGIAVPLQLQQQPRFHHAVQHGPHLPPPIRTHIQLTAQLPEAADLGRRSLDQPHEGLFQRFHVAPLEDFGCQATGACAWRLGDVRQAALFDRQLLLAASLQGLAGVLTFSLPTQAEVAELADALDSGSSGRKVVGVQVPPSAPFTFHIFQTQPLAEEPSLPGCRSGIVFPGMPSQPSIDPPRPLAQPQDEASFGPLIRTSIDHRRDGAGTLRKAMSGSRRVRSFPAHTSPRPGSVDQPTSKPFAFRRLWR